MGARLVRLQGGDVVPLVRAIEENWNSLHDWMLWAAEPPTLIERTADLLSAHDRWERGEAYEYKIVMDEEPARIAGRVALRIKDREGDIGYWLAEEHRGKGLVTAAVMALEQVMTQMPQIESAVIFCDAANTDSAAVARRAGYELEEIFEEPPKVPAGSGRMMRWRRQIAPRS